ncbi:unnamed protein product [Linum tenue]|uniref:Uncharacterized protein n=2 Tax=Linum tenue TaxID=586396 RepID=A0AAV0HDQ6_9ROSI|nr:unnamed protein product [Linum tenue]
MAPSDNRTQEQQREASSGMSLEDALEPSQPIWASVPSQERNFLGSLTVLSFLGRWVVGKLFSRQIPPRPLPSS